MIRIKRNNTAPKLLSVYGAAAYLGISYRTLMATARAGEIPYLKVGKRIRFTREVLDNWLKCNNKNTKK